MTFDDGYRDNHCYAAPILAERGLRATFFVITDLVGSPLAPWYDRLVRGWARSVRLPGGPPTDAMKLLRPDDLRRCRLSGPPTPRQVVSQAKSLPPSVRAELLRRVESHAGPDEAQDVDQIMGWSELSSLAAAGHEIGSHSATHPILTQLDEPALMHEIHGSRSCLAERLGKPVVSFCYPNGDLDDRVVQAVSSAGYRYAVTTRSAINTPGANPHRLARRFIDQDRLSSLGGAPSATLFQAELSGVIDLLFLRHLRACRT